ncbi:MAG TPA: serine--tRNA ligase [Gemmatimonadaceae bacterium]|nr:serine--tRNA ligase [Gemmatimonadaceae bacterium]
MHDLRMVREQGEALRAGIRRRGGEDFLPLIERAEHLEQERRTTLQAVEERKAAKNAMSAEVARRKRAGEDADDVLSQSRSLGDEITRLEQELEAAEQQLRDILLELPNLPLPDTPDGDAASNREVRNWGTVRRADELRPHWELAEALKLVDFARGTRLAGSGFILYRGLGAKLVRALMTMMIDTHTRDHGYEEVWVPALVNRDSMTGTSQLPKFEDDMYALRNDELFLIPTAEVPVTNIHRDEILPAASLPKGYVAYSPCFRREAGAAGKDTRGLLRVHQFDKVELVWFTTPEQSPQQLELLTTHAERILRDLELPYRVVLLAAGDTGFASAKTYDLEVFAPAVGKWLEVSSCSVFTDFQARRANIRYRPAEGGKPRFVHTLNGSALAFPRVIAALLEHFQNGDGTVTIPDALRPYLGVDRLA